MVQVIAVYRGGYGLGVDLEQKRGHVVGAHDMRSDGDFSVSEMIGGSR